MLIAPRGNVDYNSRRAEGLHIGAAHISLDLAREGLPVLIVPIALNYDGDHFSEKWLSDWARNLEKLLKLPKPPANLTLADRLERLLETITNKRIQEAIPLTNHRPNSSDNVYNHIDRLNFEVETALENKYRGHPHVQDAMETRARFLMRVLKTSRHPDAKADLEILKNVSRLTGFLRNYLRDDDRYTLYETLMKLEYAITGKNRPAWQTSRHLRVRIRVGDPLDASKAAQQDPAGLGLDPVHLLTGRLRTRLQHLINQR
jgi:hypothetical protein